MDERKVQVFRLSHDRAGRVSSASPVERQELKASPAAWSGIAYTAAGVPSPWHHHSDNDTHGYVIAGRLRLEFGPGGGEAVEAGPGDAFFVPKAMIHREITLGTDPGVIFVVRVGSGEPFVNVDLPEPM